MRRQWTDELIREEILRIAAERIMPTASQMRSAGRNDLACAISKRGGFDAWADKCGLERSYHDSRKGWSWETWLADQAASRSLSVVRAAAVKSPFDLKVNGRTVNVKVATASFISGGHQWTWRVGRSRHDVDFYALIATGAGPPIVMVVPSGVMPLTCATSRGTGKYSAYIDRWELF